MGQASGSLKGLRVCYFGHYDPGYSRNRVILKALKRAEAYVMEVHNLSRDQPVAEPAFERLNSAI